VTIERVNPDYYGDEPTMLRGFLDYHRDTLRLKCDGLDQQQLAQQLAPSTMTLGGLLKHMALVEDNWFSVVLLGNEDADPWKDVDWDADRDWEWHTAADDSPEELRSLFDQAVAASDRILDEVIPAEGLGKKSAQTSRRTGDLFTLRWIFLHMIEEYARHNGHADLLRESVDGTVGD
jgi:uncharacterized damage-inducible protein DinB